MRSSFFLFIQMDEMFLFSFIIHSTYIILICSTLYVYKCYFGITRFLLMKNSNSIQTIEECPLSSLGVEKKKIELEQTNNSITEDRVITEPLICNSDIVEISHISNDLRFFLKSSFAKSNRKFRQYLHRRTSLALTRKLTDLVCHFTQ